MGKLALFCAFYGGQQSQRDDAPIPLLDSPAMGMVAMLTRSEHSEHGVPWRDTIRGESLAGMTATALHARENASMPPRESHGRLGPIGKTGIRITAGSISSHSLTAVLVPLTTILAPLATRHYLPRPSPAGYCLTPTAELAKPIGTRSRRAPRLYSVCHETRQFLRTNQSVSPRSPLPPVRAIRSRGRRCSTPRAPDVPAGWPSAAMPALSFLFLLIAAQRT